MPVQIGSAFGKVTIDASGVKKGIGEAQTSVAAFNQTLRTGQPTLRAYGGQLLDTGRSAGLSESQIRKMASATGIWTDNQLLAVMTSRDLTAKSRELTQAVLRGDITARQAGQEFRNYAESLGVSSKTSEELKKQQEALADTLLKVGAGMTALGAAGGAAIYSSTKLAARVETLGVVTEILGHNVGLTEADVRSLERALQEKGITLQASRQAIAQMIQAEIDLSQATDLAREAQDAAVISGENSSQAFEKIVYVIASGNIVMARRMGLLVNFQQAYEREAAALGKTSQSLTEHEKLVIRTNEVLRAGENISGAYAAAMETAGKKVTSLDRHIEESKRMLGEAWLPVYADVIDFITDSLKKWEALDQSQKENISTWLGYGSAILAAEGIMLASIGTILKLKTAVTGLTTALGLASAISLAPYAAAVAVIGALAVVIAKRQKEVNDAAEQGRMGLEQQVQSLRRAGSSWDDYVQRIKAAFHNQHLLAVEEDGVIRVYDGSTGVLRDVTDQFMLLNKEQYDNWQEADRVAQGAKEISEAYDGIENDLDEAGQGFRRLSEEEKAAAAEHAKFVESLAQTAVQAGLAGELSSIWDEYHGTIGDLETEHEQLITDLNKATKSATNFAAAGNFVKSVLAGQTGPAYTAFRDAADDLIDTHDDLERKLQQARREWGENSVQVAELTDKLAKNERQLQQTATNADLRAELQRLREQGFEPTSKEVQELEDALRENEAAQKEAAAAAALATKQFIFEKTAQNLTAAESLELARALGILDEDSYNAALAATELNEQYKQTGDLEAYYGATADLAYWIGRLKSKNITITTTIIEKYQRQVQEELAKPDYDIGGGPDEGIPRQTGGTILPGQRYLWNEPGNKGEILVPAGSGWILNRQDAMNAVKDAMSGGGRGGGDIKVTQHIYNPATAALATAEIRRLKRNRQNAFMGR